MTLMRMWAVLTVVSVLPVFATTYFVDNCVIVGSDSNNGTSITTPWLTVAKVNSSTFAAGDSVLFQRTCLWREQLTIPSSGASGNPLTIGAYGSGAAPVLRGADFLTSWTPELNYSGGVSQTVYYTSASVQPKQVFQDGARLATAASKSAMTPGSAWWDATNNRIYVETTAADPPAGHTIENSTRDYGATANRKSYLTVTGLQFDMGLLGGYYQTGGGTGITLQGLTVLSNSWFGILLDDQTNAWNNITVMYCVARYNGGTGIGLDQIGDNIVIQSNDASWNVQLNTVPDFQAGIRLYGGTSTGTSNPNTLTHVLIKWNSTDHNGIDSNSERGYGIWCDTCGGTQLLTANEASWNSKGGLQMECATFGGTMSYNVAHHNGTAGILLSRWAHGTTVSNNTAYANLWNIWIQGQFGGGDAYKMQNNLIENNLAMGATGSGLRAIYGGENDGVNGSGNVYAYNDIGPAASGFVEWGIGTLYGTLASWQTASSQANNLAVDPLLANPGPGIFNLGGSLSVGSPAIGAGTNIGVNYNQALNPATPFPWELVTQCSAWNIGAFGQSGC